jgi:hypothetical protein
VGEPVSRVVERQTADAVGDNRLVVGIDDQVSGNALVRVSRDDLGDDWELAEARVDLEAVVRNRPGVGSGRFVNRSVRVSAGTLAAGVLSK